MSTQRTSAYFVLLLSLWFAMFLGVRTVSASSDTPTIYFPQIVGYVDECALTDQEAALVALLQNLPGQGRATFVCNAILQRTARLQAQDMATRGYCATIDPDGFGPNYRVSAAGYVLPTYYNTTQDANNIQSVACGYASAEAMLQAALPNDHLEGKGKFWSAQTDYGIAYYEAPTAPFGHFWVVITAQPGK
jgi:uncharacterized protein YkwD